MATWPSARPAPRYKKDIESLGPVGYLVARLRPVSYRWIDSDIEEIGLVAEEVAEVEPRLATYNAEGQIEGVRYRQLAALLVGALQEQQAEIAELKTDAETPRKPQGRQCSAGRAPGPAGSAT